MSLSFLSSDSSLVSASSPFPFPLPLAAAPSALASAASTSSAGFFAPLAEDAGLVDLGLAAFSDLGAADVLVSALGSSPPFAALPFAPFCELSMKSVH